MSSRESVHEALEFLNTVLSAEDIVVEAPAEQPNSLLLQNESRDAVVVWKALIECGPTPSLSLSCVPPSHLSKSKKAQFLGKCDGVCDECNVVLRENEAGQEISLDACASLLFVINELRQRIGELQEEYKAPESPFMRVRNDGMKKQLSSGSIASSYSEKELSEDLTSGTPRSSPSVVNEDGTCCALYHFDHMRDAPKYVRTVVDWASDLALSGFIVIPSLGSDEDAESALVTGQLGLREVPHHLKYVFMAVCGREASVLEWQKRVRTRSVDVDARGRACREKFLQMIGRCTVRQAETRGIPQDFLEILHCNVGKEKLFTLDALRSRSLEQLAGYLDS